MQEKTLSDMYNPLFLFSPYLLKGLFVIPAISFEKYNMLQFFIVS